MKNNTNPLEGIWYFCKFNGYNEIIFEKDSAIYFINDSYVRKIKYTLQDDILTAHYNNLKDTMIFWQVNIINDSLIDLVQF
jgi:hypothetical protein